MQDLPKCYGAYGTSDCGDCEYAEWCVTSADPALLSDNGNIIPIFENFRQHYDISVGVNDSTRLSKLFAELIYELDCDNADLLWDFLATMSALSKSYPALYRVVRMRILYPTDTLESIGERLGITKECVCMNLNKSVEKIPALRNAIGIPAERLAKSRTMPFEVRCSGGKICILAGAASVVLSMPMDEKNSKAVGKLCDGLNNMHWKKRDALLEDLR